MGDKIYFSKQPKITCKLQLFVGPIQNLIIHMSELSDALKHKSKQKRQAQNKINNKTQEE